MKLSRKAKKEIVELVRTRQYETALRKCQAIRRESASKGETSDKIPSEVLYYGCCALFGLGHVQQAGDWVDAHGEATNFSPANLYLEALLHLHENSVDEALGCWTGIVQSDPAETLADVLIEKIKSEEDRTLRELVSPSAFEEFVPLPWTRQSAYRPGRKFFEPSKGKATKGSDPAERSASKQARATAGRRTNQARETKPGLLKQAWSLPGVKPALAGILFLSLLLAGIYYFEPGALKPGNWTGVLEDRLPATPSGGSVIPASKLGEEPRFSYDTRDAVIAEYNRARELAMQGRPNQSRFLLGKIEWSNATFEIKERALLLRDSLPYLRREHFEDAITPAQVAANPYLLRGGQVLWSGRAQNPTATDQGLRFKLDAPVSVDPPANPSIPSLSSDSNPPPLTTEIDDPGGEGVIGAEILKPGGAPATVPLPEILVNYALQGGTLPEIQAGQRVQVFGVLEESEAGRILLRAREIMPQ